MPKIDSEHCFLPRQSLSLMLAMLLVACDLPAQDRNKQPAARDSGLKIYVLEGSGAVNFIPDGHGTTPVVEVRDVNEFPVSGATVEFRLPETGPGGDFPNGQHAVTAVTNNAGQAEAAFTVRPQPGTFTIGVTAKMDTRAGYAVITQVNSLKASEAAKATSKSHHWYKNWKILAIAGAGVVVLAVVLATRGGGGSGSGTSVGLTPGIPTFGAPH